MNRLMLLSVAFSFLPMASPATANDEETATADSFQQLGSLSYGPSHRISTLHPMATW